MIERDQPMIGSPLVHTSDLGELVDKVTRLLSSHTVCPARSGGFTADVEGFQGPELSMFHLDYRMPLRMRAARLDDYLAVCLPLTGSMGVAHKGVSFQAVAGARGFLGTPDAELVMDWDEQLTLLVLRVELTPLRRMAARMITDIPGQVDGLDFEPVMDSGTVVPAALSQALLLARLVGAAQGREVNPLAAAQLREQVLGTLLLGQPNSWSRVLCSGAQRRSARSTIRDAAEYIGLHAHEPLSIAGIARAVGLSERALQAGFRREFDLSPKQYLQQIRLDRAHDELAAAGPDVRVIDVAHRWGFTNAGRLAAAYRRRFATTPSATLFHATPP
ncbi:AraC family transcriptional regulator [Pseudonocardia nantongensis]|uniref:AraC family transcriptional regulator n=1 Tax=Pseudonocardia nantongensis TaxID=1181885 RepID=UPI003978712D